MAVYLLVPAAGSGSRLARPEPKALVPLAGRPLLEWTLEALSALPFREVVVAAPPERRSDFGRLLGGRARVVSGGETRAASVRACFFAISAAPDDLVCIHDAARPFVSSEEAAAVIRAAEESGAAIAGTPIVDTVKRVDSGRVLGTLDRNGLVAAGTPQVFRAELLGRILSSGREATDEAGLCEMLGFPVSVVAVSRRGFKITTPEDLELAAGILASRTG